MYLHQCTKTLLKFMKLKKHRWLIAFALIICLTNAYSQGSYPIVEWSPEYNIRNAKFDRILQAGESGFFTYRKGSNSVLSAARDEYFAYYNRFDLSEEWLLKNPRWEWNERKVLFKQGLMLGDTQFLFYESYNPQTDEKYLLVRTLDTLANLSEPKLIETFDSRRRYDGDFIIRASHDGSKFAVFTAPPDKRGGSENFYIRVYSQNIEELWNADIELTYADRNFNILVFDLTNSGDVFVLSAFDDRFGIARTTGKNIEYKLLRIGSGEENQITEFNLGLENVAVQSVGIDCDLKGDEMAVSGFYGNRNMSDMNGAFYISINQKTGELVSSNMDPFSEGFISQFNRFRARRGRGIRRDFVFRQFLPRPGGGVYVIAEDYEVRVVTQQTGRGVTTTTYYYHYNDIIVLSIDKEGEVDWYAHIPKRQTSVNDGGLYLGYTFTVNDDGLHFVYNDHKKNAKRWGKKTLRPVTNAKNGTLVMVSLSHDAQMTYTVLNRNKREKFRVTPKYSRSANEGYDGAVLLSLRGSRIRFGNLYFE